MMNKKQLYYFSGKKIQVDDIVQYGDSQGKIVFIVNTDCYSENYTKEEWAYLEEGFGVETEKYGLIHDSKPSEDLALIKRNNQDNSKSEKTDIIKLSKELFDTRNKIREIEAKALKKLSEKSGNTPDDIA